MEQLYQLRKEQYPEYLVLQAPFYYKVGQSLANYVECNVNEMNELKPLEVPEDPDEEADQEIIEAGNEQDEESEGHDEDEPKIEDVIDSKQD